MIKQLQGKPVLSVSSVANDQVYVVTEVQVPLERKAPHEGRHRPCDSSVVAVYKRQKSTIVRKPIDSVASPCHKAHSRLTYTFAHILEANSSSDG